MIVSQPLALQSHIVGVSLYSPNGTTFMSPIMIFQLQNFREITTFAGKINFSHVASLPAMQPTIRTPGGHFPPL